MFLIARTINNMNKILLGMIGTGWIGRNYANDFERRGYKIIRYSKDEEYIKNKDKIADCDIVFIAVPTPSTPQGFDTSALEEVIKLVGKDKIAVIKSTILPGTTERIQKDNPDVFLMHSPEFLTEATAPFDVANPARNIIGYTEKSESRTGEVFNVLPVAPYEKAVPSREAELCKYGGNCWFYFKVVFMNILYDLATELNVDYDILIDLMAADKRIGRTHLDAVHKKGRGAGGHCFIKDMSAFAEIYQNLCPDDKRGIDLLGRMQYKNIELLMKSGKDLELLKGVYGEIKE